jgi:hypothetical protein
VTEPSTPYDDAALILDSVLDDDPDGVVNQFDKVRARSGVEGMYSVAVCLAATLVGDQAKPGLWALDFPDIDRAAYGPRWVARFVSAYINDDEPTASALFGAAMADGLLADCLLTLADSTIATLRRRV